MVESASAFTKTNISTNGKSMTGEKARRLILSGVTDILVSIDGVSQEVYEQYRIGGSSSKAFSALKMLQELNLKYDSKVKIIPQFIVFKHNQHEMKAFYKICSSMGLKALFKAPYIRSDSRYQNSDNPNFTRSSYPDIESLKQAMSKGCGNPKEVFTVLLDGNCVMCCYDHNGVATYGNIYSQYVMDIWNSPKYMKDRLDILTGNAPKFCTDYCLRWRLRRPETKVTNVQSCDVVLTFEIMGVSLQFAVARQPRLKDIIMEINNYLNEGKLELASNLIKKELGYLAKSDVILEKIHKQKASEGVMAV